MHRQTIIEEEEKTRIQNDIRILTERLAKVNESLAKKMAQRNEFDKTIAETEAAYMKVCMFILHCCLKLLLVWKQISSLHVWQRGRMESNRQ